MSRATLERVLRRGWWMERRVTVNDRHLCELYFAPGRLSAVQTSCSQNQNQGLPSNQEDIHIQSWRYEHYRKAEEPDGAEFLEFSQQVFRVWAFVCRVQ